MTVHVAGQVGGAFRRHEAVATAHKALMSGLCAFRWKDTRKVLGSLPPSLVNRSGPADSRSPPPRGLTPAFVKAEGCAGMTESTSHLARRNCLEDRIHRRIDHDSRGSDRT